MAFECHGNVAKSEDLEFMSYHHLGDVIVVPWEKFNIYVYLQVLRKHVELRKCIKDGFKVSPIFHWQRNVCEFGFEFLFAQFTWKTITVELFAIFLC